MAYYDVHCHIDMCKNSEEVIKNAEKANVVAITQGVNPAANRKALEFASKSKNVKCALGFYPVEAAEASETEFDTELAFIEKKGKEERIAAIGEVGLDLKESDKLEKQKRNFLKFIELSNKLDVPIIVHSRKAEEEAVEILEKAGAKKVIMHCFNGNFKLVERIRKNGWSFSIPAIIKFSEHFQKIVRETPIEQLFCETDSPFLHPNKERNNEPALVVESYKKIAEIKGLKIEEVEKKIEQNYRKMFKH